MSTRRAPRSRRRSRAGAGWLRRRRRHGGDRQRLTRLRLYARYLLRGIIVKSNGGRTRQKEGWTSANDATMRTHSTRPRPTSNAASGPVIAHPHPSPAPPIRCSNRPPQPRPLPPLPLRMPRRPIDDGVKRWPIFLKGCFVAVTFESAPRANVPALWQPSHSPWGVGLTSEPSKAKNGPR